MSNRISIDKVVVRGKCINYKYTIDGEWSRMFNSDYMNIEYSIDVSSVPQSIAIVPFLANILPIAWVFDAKIEAEVCDKDFYDSIDDFKKGYIAMYPMLEFKGLLEVKELVENKVSGDGALAFFSGGVDAFNTLVKHADEKPTLVTLWGADIKLTDADGWNNVATHIKNTAIEFNLDYVFVKSEFRDFIKDWSLSVAVAKSGDGWWHGFQHGIGVICHGAPISYVMGKRSAYFASTFTEKEKGKYTCASDPTIDNFVRFCGTTVIHDGYEFDRQDKIHNIVEYSKTKSKKIALRVCWEASGGSNCCKCEKCLRTILGVYAEGANPLDYGFEYDDFSPICKLIYGTRERMVKYRDALYAPIQNRIREVYTLDSVAPELRWFYKVNLDILQFRYFRKTLFKRVVNKIKWIMMKK